MDKKMVAAELVRIAKSLSAVEGNRGAYGIDQINDMVDGIIKLQSQAKNLNRMMADGNFPVLSERDMRMFAELWDKLNAWKIDLGLFSRRGN